MPNHITNCLEISHKDPKKIKWLKSCWNKKENHLDFGKIIPTPKNYYDGSIGFSKDGSVPTKEEVAAKGQIDWYTWNIDNWGTKWNSYQGTLYDSKDKFVCQFLTAWGPPEPIFDKLTDMGFEVKGLWKDEGDSEVHPIGEDAGNWYTDVSFEYCG